MRFFECFTCFCCACSLGLCAKSDSADQCNLGLGPHVGFGGHSVSMGVEGCECVQAQALQRQLKMHHVRLRYNDPRMPSTVDTCGPLATDSALPGQAAVPGLNPLDTSEALSLAYHMAHEYRI